LDLETTALVYEEITLPTFGIGTAAFLLAVLLPSFAILGFLSGRSIRRRRLEAGQEVDLRAGEASLGAIMALLGLLLAFSFGSALSLLESRKTDIITEANALGTAFLRADYLPEPGRSDLREALYAYAQTRIVSETQGIASAEEIRAFIDRSLQAQAPLWPLTVELTAPPVPAPIATFVAGSVNDVLDAHQLRMRSLAVPVAELSQGIVILTALAGLFLLGNRSGIAGRQLTWRIFMFSALLLLVMITVIDVQRATQGVIRVDQSALKAAILDMQASLS
jgi:hypothetical protein